MIHFSRLVLAFVMIGAMGCDKGDAPAAAPSKAAEQPSASTPAGASGAIAEPAAATASTPASPTAAARAGWPTEDEVKAAIFKIEYGIYASEQNKSVWKVKEMKHEVKSVKFGQTTTQKQMTYGAAAITVYPVKVQYTRTVEYQHKPPEVTDEGKDGVWFLYKDSFGEWTGKYGNE